MFFVFCFFYVDVVVVDDVVVVVVVNVVAVVIVVVVNIVTVVVVVVVAVKSPFNDFCPMRTNPSNSEFCSMISLTTRYSCIYFQRCIRSYMYEAILS